MNLSARDSVVLAYDDRKVFAGPFASHTQVRDYCAINRKTDDRVWTLYVLGRPPEMYRVVGGYVVGDGDGN